MPAAFPPPGWVGDGLTTPLTPDPPPQPAHTPRLRRQWKRPALSVDGQAWNQLPVFSFSPSSGLWFAKLPGTVWGTTRPAAFRTRSACLRWLQQEYRALWGLKPDTPVEVRYEPPLRRRRLTPAELQAYLAAREAGWTPAQRFARITLPAQFRGLTPAQRAAVSNALAALDQLRRDSPDDALERRRHPAAPRADYAGTRAPDDPDGWFRDDTTFFVTPLERPGERPLYAPWVLLADGRPYARWAFLTPAAATAFCYDHGAVWVEARRSRAIQDQDQRRPLPLYVDDATLAAARARLAAARPPLAPPA
jgi:hypothetical protein